MLLGFCFTRPIALHAFRDHATGAETPSHFDEVLGGVEFISFDQRIGLSVFLTLESVL